MTDSTVNKNAETQLTHILVAATADGSGPIYAMPPRIHAVAVQGNIVGTSGAQSATVTIEGSLDGVNWKTALVSLSLSGTSSDSKFGTLVDAPYPLLRARTASTTGTGATVDVFMAY